MAHTEQILKDVAHQLDTAASRLRALLTDLNKDAADDSDVEPKSSSGKSTTEGSGSRFGRRGESSSR